MTFKDYAFLALAAVSGLAFVVASWVFIVAIGQL